MLLWLCQLNGGYGEIASIIEVFNSKCHPFPLGTVFSSLMFAQGIGAAGGGGEQFFFVSCCLGTERAVFFLRRH